MSLAVAALLFLVSFSASESKYQFRNHPETVLYSNNGTRVSGIQDHFQKDIVLGGLFTVYYDLGGTGEGSCGNVIFEAGIEMLEAMLHAIDSINSDQNLLPNMTLGYDIRDTCKRENIALDETIDMLFSSTDIQLDSASCQNSNMTLQSPVSVIVGAYESFLSIPVASLLRLFKKPQISYGSSSTALSNREFYSYFYRTFPPDDQQAQAMIDLILHFGWDHISTINSNNLYGQRGIEEVKKHAAANGICIDFDGFITNEFKIPDYIALARRLLNSSSDVVILFASLHEAETFLKELSKLHSSLKSNRHFLWIASDAWAELTDEDFNNITSGKFAFPVYSKIYGSFNSYFSQLSPSVNLRDPWFSRYYEQYCKENNCIHNSSITDTPGFRQFSVVPLVTDAVYAAAHAINNFIQDNCPHPLHWQPHNQSCIGYNKSLDSETLRQYINRVNFTSPTGNRVAFDEFGNVQAKYTILNYQLVTSLSCQSLKCSQDFELREVGVWDGSALGDRLEIFSNFTKQFGINQTTGDVLFSLNSYCQSCSLGYFKRVVTSSCCGTCDPCLGSNYTNTNSSTMCMTCPDNMWGNNPLTGNTHCIDIDESYLKPSDAWGIVLIILAIIGLIAVVSVTSVFIWFWNTPIVKSSGREQMMLVLIGITLCLLSALLFLIKPSPTVCGLQRISLWFSSSLILSALLVKLIRITRIFMQRKVTTRPMFIAPAYQILFTFILVGFQMLLVIISLSVAPPNIKQTKQYNSENYNDYPTLTLQCTLPHTATIVLQMLYYSILLITSNVLAVFTIRFPANFNESKYVSFATFSLTFLWLVFIPSYIITANTATQGYVMSFMIQMSSIVTLLCLFGPRSFIMIFLPKMNVNKLQPTPNIKGFDKGIALKANIDSPANTVTKGTILDSQKE
ncbi:PREDICTED: metabotropic glutamate receptor 3-like [Amphimedon queenslandica]|uniref:G-protein coupled receptors family 3 profile domain-containing protein n=1 Tax=Amphimedon queenslandica TaxID=400682 RepID=A0A1X7V219_AMPQE|nr:PREDICTED: metabotropic glutamate receptor 3-like [Amphimedon queenslandica]|eukprot:XP_003385907.3 PREDICTED: metabotropic glutamate receptor 3-like [Amphimedon queenslandica]